MVDAQIARRVRRLLGAVKDPELPCISVVDLGIVRDIGFDKRGALVVGITPTYSGCPAFEVIERDIAACLRAAGFAEVAVCKRLSPPWSSDWISAKGRRALAAAGVAPPGASENPVGVFARATHCPKCQSADVEVISEFGATACKALLRCRACREPFEYFKPI
jgi:ring-1,2-phenylacetyl-CoA epoxidase subunit PaaD